MRYNLQAFREDLPALLILAPLLLLPALAVTLTEWAPGLWIVPLIMALGLLTGFALAVSSLPDLLAVMFSTLYGYFAVWLMTAQAALEGGSLRDRLVAVILRLSDWFIAALSDGFSQDNLVFVFLIGFMAWFLAYNAAWNLFGLRRLWQAVIPPGLALVLVMYHYQGDFPMQWLLLALLFLAFALAARTHIHNRERFWQHNRISYTPGLSLGLLQAGALAGALLLALASIIPAATEIDRLSRFVEDENSPWQRIEDTWERLFGGVEVVTTPVYYSGSELTLGGEINLGRAPVFTVEAPQGLRLYWRSRVFDTYAGGGWSTQSEGRVTSLLGALPPEGGEVLQGRIPVEQTFNLSISATQILYAAGQPGSFGGLRVISDVAFNGGGDFASVHVVRLDDRIFRAGDSYRVSSSVSIADPNALRQAGTAYPDWVTARYLQLPSDITPRTVALAQSFAAASANPYDTAASIESYLRSTITYNQAISRPPEGAEPVDYFLFESREGFCTYYASAMIVMLRSVGIPARMASGFAQGEYSPTLNAYRVTEADAHTWVEVYFPGYGWVEFEPTGSQREITRSGGGGLLLPPTPTPTPSPTPDPALTGPQPLVPGTEGQAGVLATPTPTPLPERSQPDRPGRGVAGFRLPLLLGWALGLSLLGIGMFGLGWYLLGGVERIQMSEVSRSYARLNLFAGWGGLPTQPGQTPYERGESLAEALPESTRHVGEIVRHYVTEQYAPPQPLAEQQSAGVASAASWRRLRPLLIRRVIDHWLRRFTRRG